MDSMGRKNVAKNPHTHTHTAVVNFCGYCKLFVDATSFAAAY